MNRLFGRSEEVTIDSEIVSVGREDGLGQYFLAPWRRPYGVDGQDCKPMSLPDKIDDCRNRFDLVSHLNLSIDFRQCMLDRHPHGMRTIGNDQRIVCQLGQRDGRGFLAARRARRNQKELFIDDRDGLKCSLIRRVVHQRAVDPAAVEPFQNIGRQTFRGRKARVRQFSRKALTSGTVTLLPRLGGRPSVRCPVSPLRRSFNSC